MMDMRFYEFYRKFASATNEGASEPLPFDEFASLYREIELADGGPGKMASDG